MPAPDNDWWSAFWPAAGTALGASVLYVLKKFGDILWAAHSEDTKELKQDEATRRRILRTVQDQAAEELKRVYARNADLEKENAALRGEVRLWEARARRVDEIAHDMRHAWINERQAHGLYELPVIPKIPLLEESLT